MVDSNRVLLAGASGNTGKNVLNCLQKSNLTVRALTSSSEKVDQLRQQGADEVVICDLMDGTNVGDAVEDVNIIITAVGSRPKEVLSDSEFVDGIGNINLVKAAVDADVETVVMESSLGVDGDRASFMARTAGFFLGPVVEAKTRAERTIRQSDIRHTILRPGVLIGGTATGNVQVARAEAGLWGAVSRADVAQLMVAAPFTPAAAGMTFEVVRNPLFGQRSLNIDWQFR
jgi:uncharacterized protein YbjT (DUF2867 family)